MTNLSPDDIEKFVQRFQEDGYFVFPDLIEDRAIDGIMAQIGNVIDTVLVNLGREDLCSAPVDEKYLFLDSHNPTLKSHAYDMFGHLDSVRSAITDPRLIDIGRTIFDSALLFDHIQVRADSSRNDRVLPLHQELGQMSLLNMTIWVPLVDVGEKGGGLVVLPGSHKRGRVAHRFFPEMNNYHGILESEYNQADLVKLRMKRGSAVAFHPHLFHGSLPNLTDRIRWTIIVRLNELSELGYLKQPLAPMRMPQHTEIDL